MTHSENSTGAVAQVTKARAAEGASAGQSLRPTACWSGGLLPIMAASSVTPTRCPLSGKEDGASRLPRVDRRLCV